MRFIKDFLYVFVVIGIILLLAVATAYIWKVVMSSDFNAGSATQSKVVITGTSEAAPTYLATTTDPITKEIQIGEDSDMFCQNIYFNASNTDAVLNWQYYFSDDGTNWYGEWDNPAVSSGAYTHGAATTTHSWTPATTDERARQDCITDLNTKFIKVKFYRSSNLSGGTLFSEGFFKASY